MARRARSRRRRNMHSRQCKSCRAVVESCRRPADRRVASGAVRYRERVSGCGVRRSVGLLPGRQVAAGVPAIGRGDRQCIVVVDVAQIAGHGRVAIGQRETG